MQIALTGFFTNQLQLNLKIVKTVSQFAQSNRCLLATFALVTF